MKKTYLLFLLGLMSIMPFGFSACSDDDEKVPESSSALIGTWERISCTYQYKENGISYEDYELTEFRKI